MVYGNLNCNPNAQTCGPQCCNMYGNCPSSGIGPEAVCYYAYYNYGFNTGAGVGIGIAVTVFLLVLIAVVAYCWVKRKCTFCGLREVYDPNADPQDIYANNTIVAMNDGYPAHPGVVYADNPLPQA